MGLRVLHLIRSYGCGGGERQLALYLGASRDGDATEVEEHLVTLYRDEAMTDLVSRHAPWVEVTSLVPLWVSPHGAVLELVRLLPWLPDARARLDELLQRVSPHVCVVHGFQAAVTAARAARRWRTVRWVYVHRTTKRRSRAQFAFRWLYAPYDAVAGVSESSTRSLAPYVRPERLRTLPNGIDVAPFESVHEKVGRASRGDAPLVVVTVGRLVRGKGLDLLVDAFERVALRRPGVELWIVGDGPLRRWLERRTKASAVPGAFRLLGFRRDVPSVLSKADVFAFASENEGLSNAVLEAMAVGLPSVVIDAPGVSECHVHGETALVVRRDANGVADALERLLTDEALRRRMGAAARRRVRAAYAIGRSRARYLELFRELVGEGACAES